jgi:hypothetical protein
MSSRAANCDRDRARPPALLHTDIIRRLLLSSSESYFARRGLVRADSAAGNLNQTSPPRVRHSLITAGQPPRPVSPLSQVSKQGRFNWAPARRPGLRQHPTP